MGGGRGWVATKLNPSVILSQKSMSFNELLIREESYYDQARANDKGILNNVTLNVVEGSPQF